MGRIKFEASPEEHDFYRHLGERLRQARQLKGYTAQKAAASVDIMSTAHLTQAERAETRLNLYDFFQLCQELDVSPNELLNPADSEGSPSPLQVVQKQLQEAERRNKRLEAILDGIAHAARTGHWQRIHPNRRP